MKPIAFKETTIQSSSDTIECSVESADTRHLFNLLVNAYSDPIGSTVREVVSNAFDATIELMKETGQDINQYLLQHPVDVNLTSSQFTVRDYGIGMDEERIHTLYANLGKSSKRGSNDYIGAFGIGRFAPLSYTDNFVVVTVKNGIKRTFQLVGTEVPKIVPIGEMATDEHSGTSIIINIKADDRTEFVYAIKNQLRYMENIFYGGAVEHLNREHLHKENEFWLSSIRASHSDWRKNSTYHCLVGRVAYPINEEKVTGLRSIDPQMGIKLEIGDVAVTPNREQLLYTEHTVTAINNAIKAARKRLEELSKEQSEVTEDFELYMKYLSTKKPLVLGNFVITVSSIGINITNLYKPFVDIGINTAIEPFLSWTFIDPFNKAKSKYRQTPLTFERLKESWYKTMKVYKPKVDHLGCKYFMHRSPVSLTEFLREAKIHYVKDFNSLNPGAHADPAERKKHVELKEKYEAISLKVLDTHCKGNYDTAEFTKAKAVKKAKKLMIHITNIHGTFISNETDEDKLCNMPFPFIWIDFTSGTFDNDAKICHNIFNQPVHKLSKESQKYMPRHAMSPKDYVDKYGKQLKREYAEYMLANFICFRNFDAEYNMFCEIPEFKYFVDKLKKILAFKDSHTFSIELDYNLVRKSTKIALQKFINFVSAADGRAIMSKISKEECHYFLSLKGILGPKAQAEAVNRKKSIKPIEKWLL